MTKCCLVLPIISWKIKQKRTEINFHQEGKLIYSLRKQISKIQRKNKYDPRVRDPQKDRRPSKKHLTIKLQMIWVSNKLRHQCDYTLSFG